MTTQTSIKKILLLAANPKDTPPLRLDEEVREIEAGLRRSHNRGNFTLIQKWALRTRDIRQAMLDVRPQIVHFSGHGSSDGGLALEDTNGNSKLLEPSALAGLFELFTDNVECVLLNACYSETQADAIIKHINYVIGMSQSIGDRAAIEFAIGFYDALGAGETINMAFKFGCNALRLEGIAEYMTPILKKKKQSAPLNESRKKPTKKWVLVMSTTIKEIDRRKVEAIITHLQQLSKDTSITLLKIMSGRLLLVLESSNEAYEIISGLIKAGKLKEILDVPIEEIRLVTDKSEEVVDYNQITLDTL